MTRVYQDNTAVRAPAGCTRVVIIGAGHYPSAQRPQRADIPRFSHLTSVGPSVQLFAKELITKWRADLAAPLGTVDLLLSQPQSPNGSRWSVLGVPNETLVDQAALDPPTLPNVRAAMGAALLGARPVDQLLVYCCGHGFWKTERFFVLSDFGSDPLDPWTGVIALDRLTLGLREKEPRNQWLFYDCCSDIPEELLGALSPIGTPIVAPSAAGLISANSFGTLAQFGLTSSAPGQQAFGKTNEETRFTVMLVEAVNGSGAIAKHQGDWWIDHRGLDDAIKSYHFRTPNLGDPEFYRFAMPIFSDTPGRMRLRRLRDEPESCVVAVSSPPSRLTGALIEVTQPGAPGPDRRFRAARAREHIKLPARRFCKVAATFADDSRGEVEVFADLPVADPDLAVL